MGGLLALGIVACVAGMAVCWDGLHPRREFESIDKHRRTSELLAPEEKS